MVPTKVDGGVTVWFDPETLSAAYGGHAVRVALDGDIEILIANTDGAEWQSVTQLELVQPAGKPAKARKQ